MQVPVLLHPTALIILVQANEMPYVPMNHDCGRWFETGKNPSSCRYSHHCTILYPYLYIYIYVHYDYVKYTNLFVNLLQHFLEAPTHNDTRTHANAHLYYIWIWYLSVGIFPLPLHCHAKFLVISGTCILWRTSTGSWCCWDSFGFWASSLVDHQQCACRRFPFSFGTGGDAMSWGTKLRVLKTPWLWEMSKQVLFLKPGRNAPKKSVFQHYDLGFHWKRPSNNPLC